MIATGNYGHESAGAGYLTVPSGFIEKAHIIKASAGALPRRWAFPVDAIAPSTGRADGAWQP